MPVTGNSADDETVDEERLDEEPVAEEEEPANVEPEPAAEPTPQPALEAGQMRMLVHRRGDVAIGFQPRLLYNMKKAGVTLDQVNFQDVSGIIPTQQMYIAFSPKLPPAFSGFLNERLSNMKSDGTIAKILQKYFCDEFVAYI